MVDKLKLIYDKHPHPYLIALFKKGMKSNERCLVKFSIGKTYNDEVWCDVIPMNACHLCLGRPWKYDKKFMHDGENNTYTFWKDGSKIILLPLKDEGKVDNMLQKKNLVKEIKVIGLCYALMAQRGEGEDIPIPTEVDQESYRMSPPQHVEFNRQAMNLIKKGVVRNNMSLCAISTLLTPKKDGMWQV